MIRIFGQTDTVFTTNGDCVLQPLKAIVHQYQNSDFYLELEASLDYVQFFEQGRLVVADYLDTQQIFRMWNVVKTKDRVKAKCWHVFYDLKYRITPPVQNGDNALGIPAFDRIYNVLSCAYDPRHYLGDTNIPYTYGSSGFTIIDFVHTDQFDWVWIDVDKFFRGKSVYDIIKWIMEQFSPSDLYIDNFSFGIKYLSWDYPEREFEIRYGKNLKEITKEEDWSDVCTHLFAVGKDGLSKTYESNVQYSIPYPKVVNFQQNITASNYASDADYQQALITDLDNQAQTYLSTNKYPRIKYSVKAYLGSFDSLHNVRLGDEIDVIDEQLGIKVATKVIGYDYDINAQMYRDLTFGNYTSSMKGYNSKIEEAFDNMKANSTLYTYPVGSIYSYYDISDTGLNPNHYGLDGSWTLISTSGHTYTWRRVS